MYFLPMLTISGLRIGYNSVEKSSSGAFIDTEASICFETGIKSYTAGTKRRGAE